MLPRQIFIQQELSREYYDFPATIDEAYSATYAWIINQEGMKDFDKAGPPTNLNNAEDCLEARINTAREFTYLLPAHTLKLYRALLKIEKGAKSSSHQVILDKPDILLVAVGCGGGTASIALISLLLNYQEYRYSHNLPITTVNVRIAAIDPNDFAIGIYNTLIGECQKRVQKNLIDLAVELIPERFIESMPSLLEWVKSSGDRINTCAIAFGNVIRPFIAENESRKERRGRFSDLVARFLPVGWGEPKSIEEERLVNTLFEHTNIDIVVIPLLASQSNRPNRDWFQELSDFQYAMYKALKVAHHQVVCEEITKGTVTILGPEDCYFRKHRNKNNPYPIKKYSWGYITVQRQDFINDKDWERILSRENLLLAWARVRNALSFEMIEDTLEIRLFEAFIDENIERLRNQVLSYQWDALEIAQMLHYRMPKGADKDPRPLSICRLEDQILATAIAQIKGNEHPYPNKRSFAYRLNGANTGENLYEDWFSGYTKFIDASRKAAENHRDYQVIQADLSSYYTDVLQKQLFQKVENLWQIYGSRVSDLTSNLLLRDCGLGKPDCGIPQGHIISGVLSNIYLSGIDDSFGPGNDWGIEYFRYVDDMIFLIPPSLNVDEIVEKLDQQLSNENTITNLGLTRSESKTSRMSVQEFLELTEKDPDLNQISKEFNFLLSDLYKLNANYQQLLQDYWWDFIQLYQRLLASIGVYISKSRLSRKLNRNMFWWNRLKFYFFPRIKLPPVKKLDDLKDIVVWRNEFISHFANKNWLDKRQNIVEELLDLLRSSSTVFQDPEVSKSEQIKARRRYKFAVNRLGKLSYESIIDHIVQGMINQPWMYPIRRVSQDLALQNNDVALLAIHEGLAERNGNEWAYVRAVILKAFSELMNPSNNIVDLLQHEIIHGKTTLEKTMAAETLILMHRDPGIAKSVLTKLAQTADHSALMKNYAVSHTLAVGDDNLPQINLEKSRTLNSALEYLRIDPELQMISREEPDIIRSEFYERDYPDDESEFPEIPSWAY